MSDEFVPESVGVGIVPNQPAEVSSCPSEFELGYYGWRVVLAACLGVMAGFGSLFVYTFSVFVKPEGGTISHGLATALVDREGKILKIWRGNSWSPSEILRELTEGSE